MTEVRINRFTGEKAGRPKCLQAIHIFIPFGKPFCFFFSKQELGPDKK